MLQFLFIAFLLLLLQQGLNKKLCKFYGCDTGIVVYATFSFRSKCFVNNLYFVLLIIISVARFVCLLIYLQNVLSSNTL